MDGQRILVIGHTHPESGATAAGVRMLQLLRTFKENGAIVHFAVATKQGRYPDSLEALVAEIHEVRLNDSSFDALVKRLDCDIAVFDRFMTEEQFGWRVRSQLPKCKLILDTEDLHSLRLSRQEAVEKGISWDEDLWYRHPVFTRELASILRCDLSLMISRAEIDLLTGVFPWIKAQLVYAPFQMEAPDSQNDQTHESRKHFVFAGNGKHAPNADAIQILRNSIWPELSQRCPEAELHVYGAYLEEVPLGSDNYPGADRFIIKGYAPSIEEVFKKARLQLAPLRFGAGVKGKIISGLQYGLPTLSTPVGWEGIGGNSKENPLIIKEISQMISKAAELYDNEMQWEAALQQGRELAREHFANADNPKESSIGFHNEQAISREGRLLRDLLRSKAFDSSRFMSKWIEAKNSLLKKH
ncbi:Glycosyl transferases group 1 [Robiginitalea myxolifaciens]|uniref:Glycosyl transferases group 1 n=2 Tax=Robiginitalea myxolifaciens TaxID=400055 RepID=A0A1I6GXZ7_9FLAO|nr:Glycosyl transferases group 1 [Robiginitalea myxolifaciens]